MKFPLAGTKLKYQVFLLFGICVSLFLVVFITFNIRINRTIQRNASDYAYSTVYQLEKSVDIIIQGIEDIGSSIRSNKFANQYLAMNSSREMIVYRDYVKELLNNYLSTNKNIRDIVLMDRNLTALSSTAYFKYSMFSDIFGEDAIEILDRETSVFMTVGYREEILFVYVIPVFRINEKTGPASRVGNILIFCNADAINNVIDSAGLSNNSKFMFVNDKRSIVASNDRELVGQSYFPDMCPEKGYFIKREIDMADIDWKVVGFVSVDDVEKDMNAVRDSVIFIGVVTTLVLVLMGYILNRNITVPISNIVSAIENVGENNIKQRINLPTDGEIGSIVHHINNMLQKLENMTRRIFAGQQQLYEAELSKRQAEISALHSQINPHFLYNTLECIRSIATVYKSSEIISIVTAMSKILRYSIKGDEFVKVTDELEIISEYLKIMDIRFAGRIRHAVEINPEISDFIIPRMVLQPIVENAVYHGLEPKINGGMLSIEGYAEGDNIVFLVEDNGVGIEENTLSELQQLLKAESDYFRGVKSKKGIGILNINRKIKLLVGREYGIRIFSSFSGGTKVHINLPATSVMVNAASQLASYSRKLL